MSSIAILPAEEVFRDAFDDYRDECGYVSSNEPALSA